MLIPDPRRGLQACGRRRQLSETILIPDSCFPIPELGRSPLHDVRQRGRSAINRERAQIQISRRTSFRRRQRRAFASNCSGQASRSLRLVHQPQQQSFERQLAAQDWWSQTGSNRRPPACKAGALPTELWPRRDQVSVTGNQTSEAAYAPRLIADH